MLAPLHLVPLLIGVGESLPGAVPDRMERRGREHLLWHSTRELDTVELRLGGGRKLHVRGAVEPRGGEEHGTAIRGEARRQVVGGVEGEPGRLSPGRGHDEEVEVAVPVGGEGDLRPVRRPDRRGLVRRGDGQRGRGTTRGRHPPEVPPVAEDHALPVGGDRRRAQPEGLAGDRGRGGRRSKQGREQEGEPRQEMSEPLNPNHRLELPICGAPVPRSQSEGSTRGVLAAPSRRRGSAGAVRRPSSRRWKRASTGRCSSIRGPAWRIMARTRSRIAGR